jgi:hypothetical protein
VSSLEEELKKKKKTEESATVAAVSNKSEQDTKSKSSSSSSSSSSSHRHKKDKSDSRSERKSSSSSSSSHRHRRHSESEKSKEKKSEEKKSEKMKEERRPSADNRPAKPTLNIEKAAGDAKRSVGGGDTGSPKVKKSPSVIKESSIFGDVLSSIMKDDQTRKKKRRLSDIKAEKEAKVGKIVAFPVPVPFFS